MQETYWLVKSGGRILGPMTSDEVVSSLRSKEIVPLDEIAQSYGRWHYIRDEKKFEQIVLELRANKGGAENTLTATDTNTATDVTEKVTAFGSQERLSAGISEALKERVQSAREVEEAHSNASTSYYGYSKDRDFAESSRVPKLNMFIWIALVIVAAGISWRLLSGKGSSSAGGGRSLEAIMADAQIEQKIGNSGDATKYFRIALELDPRNQQALLGLGFQMAALGQTIEARGNFEKALEASPTPEVKSKALQGLALLALKNDDFPTAEKWLKELESSPGLDGYGLYTRGAVFMAQARPMDAKPVLVEALKKGVIDPVVAILLAESEYLSARDGVSPDGFKNSLEVLDSVAKAEAGFAQEALALKIHVLIESKQVSDLEKVATQLLDLDPKATDDTVLDPRIYSDRATWDHLLRYLKRSLAEVPSQPRLTAVLGLAMFKSREKLEGKRVLEDAMAKAPSDKLIRANLSYVQSMVGRDDEAQAGLAISSEGGELRLPLILQARSCREKKDYSCAEEKWKELLVKDEGSVIAFAGLAWTQIDKGNSKDAKTLAEKGLRVVPNYAPLLKAWATVERGLPK